MTFVRIATGTWLSSRFPRQDQLASMRTRFHEIVTRTGLKGKPQKPYSLEIKAGKHNLRPVNTGTHPAFGNSLEVLVAAPERKRNPADNAVEKRHCTWLSNNRVAT